MLRKILAVLAGIVAGSVIIFLTEMLGHTVYPLPEGIDIKNPESIKDYIETAPVGAFLMVILGWVFGSLTAGFVATIIAPDDYARYGMICGVILLAMGIANMAMIPHPAWMWVLGILVFLPFAWLGYKLGLRARKR